MSEHQLAVQFSARWLEKYGEPIDCDALRLNASPLMAAGRRLEAAGRLVYRDFADLLARQAEERNKFFDRPLHGTRTSFREASELEQQAIEEGVGPRLSTLARMFERELEQFESEAKKLRRSILEMATRTEERARRRAE